jgi:hypothetical protein
VSDKIEGFLEVGTCGKHLPLDQFVWEGTQEQVGS